MPSMTFSKPRSLKSLIFSVILLALGFLSSQQAFAAYTIFQFDHDCGGNPAVCALPIGQLDFDATTPASVPANSLVPITFNGTALEALGETPICPLISYGGNGPGSMGAQMPLDDSIHGNCIPKASFGSSFNNKYFTAPATAGTYSFCAEGQMNNASYMQISGGILCDNYTVTAPVTGTINVTSNNPAATWTITGPANLNGSGLSASYSNQSAGLYTIVWGAIAGYTTPPSSAFNLPAGGTLNFPQGVYLTSGTCAVGAVEVSVDICPGVCDGKLINHIRAGGTTDEWWYAGVASGCDGLMCGGRAMRYKTSAEISSVPACAPPPPSVNLNFN